MLCTLVSIQFTFVETMLRRIYLYLTDVGKMVGGELTSARILDEASFWKLSAAFW